MPTIKKIIHFHILALPLILFFSYYPRIAIYSTNSMNIELSLPLIWLVTFVFANFIFIFSQKTFFSKKKFQKLFFQIIFFCKNIFSKKINFFQKLFFTATIFLIYNFISIFWSDNKLRGALTFITIFFIYLAIIFLHKNFTFIKSRQNLLIKILFISTLAVCVFCIIQAFADSLGVPRASTLMCAGCTHLHFGFPRITGFAIEPQFMGNLLLLPILLSAHLLLTSQKTLNTITFKKRTIAIFNFIFTLSLFLTLSRGAIFAYFVGISILAIVHLKAQLLNVVKITTLGILALITCLVLQVCLAKISGTPETPRDIIAKSIHQLSLGKVDFRRPIEPPISSPPVSSSSPSSTTSTSPASNKQKSPSVSHFSGYVAESTNIRLNLAKTALKTWTSSPWNLFFGTGLGSAGASMYRINPELGSAKEIVQNQFIETLLELGLIGSGIIIIFFAQITIYIFSTRQQKSYVFLVATSVAYLVSLLFFSGLPNALHIYLLPKNYFLIPDKIQRHRHHRH